MARRDLAARKEYERQYYLKNKDKFYVRNRDGQLRRNFGIDFAQKQALWEAQHGKCAICGEALDVNDKTTHVDHDHQTGRIRGILCVRCNHGIGCFLDSTDRLAKAIEYLKK